MVSVIWDQGLETRAPPTVAMSNFVTTLRRWIAARAERYVQEGLKSIHHKLDRWLLSEAHRQLDANKAAGIDGVSKAAYAQKLSDNVDDLVRRVRSQTYRAPPVRHVDIPKPDGSTRPLGIPTYEDKVLQKAFVLLVEPVFEREFRDCSYGYREGRSCHQAVAAVDRAIHGGCHWIIELDIKNYFGSIPHQPLRDMFRRRAERSETDSRRLPRRGERSESIKDGVLNRLILGWLKAGALREGEWESKEEGTPQGGIVSPLLANLYLHEVLDTWFEDEVKPRLKGRAHLVRYADDAVLCFEREEDAARVFEVLAKRFAKHGLTLHPEKTRRVDFRPPPPGKRDAQPRSFSFLGFTFYWGKSRYGKPVNKVKTDRKRYGRALGAIYEWCQKHRHEPIKEQQRRLSEKVAGHIGYYAVSFNMESLESFIRAVERIWLKWLNRRGAPRTLCWKKFREFQARHPWPKPKIKHKLFGQSTAPTQRELRFT